MKKTTRKQIRADERTKRKAEFRAAAGIITPEEAHAAQDRRRADCISADGLLTLAASEWSHMGQRELIKLLELYQGGKK